MSYLNISDHSKSSRVDICTNIPKVCVMFLAVGCVFSDFRSRLGQKLWFTRRNAWVRQKCPHCQLIFSMKLRLYIVLTANIERRYYLILSVFQYLSFTQILHRLQHFGLLYHSCSLLSGVPVDAGIRTSNQTHPQTILPPRHAAGNELVRCQWDSRPQHTPVRVGNIEPTQLRSPQPGLQTWGIIHRQVPLWVWRPIYAVLTDYLW